MLSTSATSEARMLGGRTSRVLSRRSFAADRWASSLRHQQSPFSTAGNARSYRSGGIRFSPQKHFRLQSSMEPVDPETSSQGEPAPMKDTLSALDAMLGVEPTPELEALTGPEDQEPFLTIPLLWKGAGPMMPPPAGGSSLVAGALGAGETEPQIGAPALLSSAEYVAITLQLPERATPNQLQQGLKGVELDFVLDTACSTNFLLPPVAAGAIAGGPEVLLGAVELAGVRVIEGLTATSLFLPTAGTAGILGKSFCDCFEAMVFDWGERPGALRVYQEYEWGAEEGSAAQEVALQALPNNLLAVDVLIEGHTMRALLDTGAPISIANEAAATLLGIKPEAEVVPEEPKSSNPFDRLSKGIKKLTYPPKADNGFMVAGAGGKPIRLEVATRPVVMSLGGASPSLIQHLMNP
eukprot:CAMPEP_0118961136 /NCGR_PEP_ID=MMETSP1169-20130426/63989_1 /TAXON_ID=36882 /ORGANISM="Pyramimonas obovata, Strain CCMP722" /LENGTH=409 /DNA_ID=CAMNT_0006909289 /DNA_START=146 /DNA_END=1372 /DNA_ORIENTATION=-